MRTTIKFFQGVVPCAGVLPAGTILEVLPHWRNQNLLLFKKKPHRLRRLSDRWRPLVRWSHINFVTLFLGQQVLLTTVQIRIDRTLFGVQAQKAPKAVRRTSSRFVAAVSCVGTWKAHPGCPAFQTPSVLSSVRKMIAHSVLINAVERIRVDRTLFRAQHRMRYHPPSLGDYPVC